MLTLSLLRHAKSSWSDPRLKDFERPLNERGETAAPRVGAFMARREIAPELILCSTAVRARQTLNLLLPHLKGAPELVYEDALYLASSSTMLKRLHRVPAGVSHTMLVGHDPGMHALAVELVGSGSTEDLERLSDKFPTAGLAVIVFEASAWRELRWGGGRLDIFTSPKRLLCRERG
jgi:phosphohistidine phosphatase